MFKSLSQIIFFYCFPNYNKKPVSKQTITQHADTNHFNKHTEALESWPADEPTEPGNKKFAVVLPLAGASVGMSLLPRAMPTMAVM